MAPTGMGAGGQESFAGQKTCVGVDQSGYMYIYSVCCGVSGAARGGRASEKARLRARERGLMEWLGGRGGRGTAGLGDMYIYTRQCAFNVGSFGK